MSDVAQEAEASVDAQPVPNEAETQDQEIENKAEETDEPSPDAEQDNEPEKTVEDRLADLERDISSKQKKIDRGTAAYSALNKKHEETLRELQDLQSKVQAEEPLKEPVIDDFETMEEYQKARDEFIEKRTEQSTLQKYQENQLQQQQNELVTQRTVARQKQEAEFVVANPDYPIAKQEFDAFVQSANVSPAVANAIADQAFDGDVAQLIYHFAGNNGENMDKLQEITAMSPIKAGIEIYKIQQTLKAPEKPETKPLPKPVEKPKGGGKPRKDPMKGDVLVNLGLKEG